MMKKNVDDSWGVAAGQARHPRSDKNTYLAQDEENQGRFNCGEVHKVVGTILSERIPESEQQCAEWMQADQFPGLVVADGARVRFIENDSAKIEQIKADLLALPDVDGGTDGVDDREEDGCGLVWSIYV